MANNSRPHILVLPYPAQGHIPPLINFSKHLSAQGALVTLVNIHSIHSRLQQQQIWPSAIKLRSLSFPYDIPYGYDASSHLDQENFVQALREAQWTFEELLQQILEEEDQPRVSCIVADYLWGWHLQSARKFGITGASYWPGSATWSAVHYHLPLLISAGDAPIKDGDDNKIIDYVPGISPTKLSDFPYYARMFYRNTLEYLMEEQIKTMSCMDETSWFLVNSVEDLEPEAFKALKNVFGDKCMGIGPLFSLSPTAGSCHSLRDEAEECITWLDKQSPKSVLYISFGSVATLTDSQLEELGKGLLESQQPFLWVLRPEQEDKVLKKILELEAGELKGLIVSWAPQLQVLSHDSVGGFLSHCGWNSVFEGLSNGIPILGWPCVVEQNLNCKFLVEDLKAGLEIKHDAGKDEIKQKIDVVLTRKDSEIRRNVQTIREVIRQSIACGQDEVYGCSYKSLERFVKDICIIR